MFQHLQNFEYEQLPFKYKSCHEYGQCGTARKTNKRRRLREKNQRWDGNRSERKQIRGKIMGNPRFIKSQQNPQCSTNKVAMENTVNGGRQETINHVETQLATKNQYAILGESSMGKGDEVDVDPNHNITSVTPLEVASQDLEGDEGDSGEEENFQEATQ
jgi:hypothetical protein